MLTARIQDSTAQRLSDITKRPISKGVDKAINAVCQKLEDMQEEQTTPYCKVCSDDDGETS